MDTAAQAIRKVLALETRLADAEAGGEELQGGLLAGQSRDGIITSLEISVQKRTAVCYGLGLTDADIYGEL